jgi:hypothetical protein
MIFVLLLLLVLYLVWSPTIVCFPFTVNFSHRITSPFQSAIVLVCIFPVRSNFHVFFFFCLFFFSGFFVLAFFLPLCLLLLSSFFVFFCFVFLEHRHTFHGYYGICISFAFILPFFGCGVCRLENVSGLFLVFFCISSFLYGLQPSLSLISFLNTEPIQIYKQGNE